MDYKDTLHLPRTDFPMKANLVKKEPLMLKQWDEMDIYHKILEDRKSAKSFILHDGPPYANGHIHMGHVLNKVLKDIVIKSRTMMGYSCPYVPGWDCHGLPIEHNIEKEIGRAKKDSMPKSQFRQMCRDYARKYIEIQKDEFKRLGVFGDWDNPYLTMDFKYEADTLRELGKFVEKGLVYKQKKPVYWCYSCKTALALAEVEYQDDESDSIYVKFDFISDLGSEDRRFLGMGISAIIWTTTPWTLPANLAIAVHPDFNYAFVKVADRHAYLVAEKLVKPLMEKFSITSYEVIKVVKGKELEGYITAHPFYDRESRIILGEHVTLDAGTGLVHTAPGHGEEDYIVGSKYHLPIYSPVDDDGRFDEDIEFFAGMHVFDANKKVIEILKEKDMLVKEEKIVHSYPHCWRCKSPIIFRSTEQWFISVDKDGLRKKALEEIDNTKWIPSWGRNRIYSMMETRPDWCISRQRAWGVPIALFKCKKCGRVQFKKELIDRVADKIEEFGADVWFEKDANFFLPEGYRCECGSEEFEKENDILDVWFDSGVSHAAVLERREELSWPADMYLEGSDQHRGWFHSSLLESVGTRNKAPYKSVLTHGFVVDSKGRKMSKSLGNVIQPEKVIKKYGAELLRLWASATDYKEDVRLSDEIMKRLVDNYRKIRNTIRFLLGNLYDFDSSKALNYDELEEIDKWVLAETELLKEKLLKAYEDYDFHVIYRNMTNYCILVLSSFYLDILKDRLYCEKEDSKKRRSAQTAMSEILKVIVFYMAPILSFTAEEAYGYMEKNKESVHLEEFVPLKAEFRNEHLIEKFSELRKLKSATDKALELARSEKFIGNSLEAKVFVDVKSDKLRKIIKDMKEKDLADICIVSQFELGKTDNYLKRYFDEETQIEVFVSKAEGAKCERCWKYSQTVGSNPTQEPICDRCYSVVH
ncbi:isoleucine--tRNA ligase [Hippea jasoniae]|uniref:isoleucine--tRNA ligase n=1 Tax=Hippea jasoniae TaxID=944479 RepID=UPI00054E7064|nr:isoleucine--tRNA ligase [Hippea jasoniae]